MAGGSLETFKWAYTKASRMDFPNDDFGEINAGDATTAAAEGNSTYSALASLFGRANYMYMLIVTCLNLLLVMMVLPSLHVDIVGDSSLLYLLAGVYLRKLSLNL